MIVLHIGSFKMWNANEPGRTMNELARIFFAVAGSSEIFICVIVEVLCFSFLS